MKKETKFSDNPAAKRLETELLILPDGRILVHNLTQPFAELLHKLNPNAEQITPRLAPRASHHNHHELPN
jgi:hypothetical protein